MNFIEMTKKQQDILLEVFNSLGFVKNYKGGFNSLIETIADASNYVDDALIVFNKESHGTCVLTRDKHLIKNVRFVATHPHDASAYNIANNRMWVYFK